MVRYRQIACVLISAFVALVLWSCATRQVVQPATQATSDLIQTLRHERIEQLYYDDLPPNMKELIVRNNIVPELAKAYAQGGDDFYRFSLIVILDHRGALSNSERMIIVKCFESAVKDGSAWVRTEAVWGLGLLGDLKSVPAIIPLLDDQDVNVVNETVLTLAKLTGAKDLPISNMGMPDDERRNAVDFWKDWWNKAKRETPGV